MARNKFTATDAAGVVHTRTSDNRTYSHTVVVLPSYEFDLARANRADLKSEARTFAYYQAIAAGNDPYPGRCFRSESRGDSAESIAEEQARVAAENAKRVADAQAVVAATPTAEAYSAAEKAKRVAHVEQYMAAGYFETWQNVGWCGRRDLAASLARKMTNPQHAKVETLEAVPA